MDALLDDGEKMLDTGCWMLAQLKTRREDQVSMLEQKKSESTLHNSQLL